MPASAADPTALALLLPVSKDPLSSAKRKALFTKAGPDASGSVSLADFDAVLRGVIQVSGSFDSMSLLRSCLRTVRRGHPGFGRRIGRSEFRLVLLYVKRHFELTAGVRRLNPTFDGTLDAAAFRKAAGMLCKWGVVSHPAQVEIDFAELEAGGKVPFDAFAGWAIGQELCPSAPAAPAPAAAAAAPAAASPTRSVRSNRAPPRPSSAFVGQERVPRATSARAAPGQLGWRGGGVAPDRNADTHASGAAKPSKAEAERRLDVVAQAASRAFARAVPRSELEPPPETEAVRRRSALEKVNAEARRRAATTVSRDEHEARAWSARNNKLTRGSVRGRFDPGRAHVPAADDAPNGIPSELQADGYAVEAPGAGRKGGRPQSAPVPAVHRTDAPWVCPRCFTLQRGTSTTCVACTRSRDRTGSACAAGSSGNAGVPRHPWPALGMRPSGGRR